MGPQGASHWTKMLNDPELSGFRIRKGRVITDYASLQTAIADWLACADLTA